MANRGAQDEEAVARVSVIVPTLNEAVHLPATLEALRAQRTAARVEVTIVDGGSGDGTLAMARGAHRVLRTAPGRAGQLNAGAATGGGDLLVFLHADTFLSPDAIEQMVRATANPRCVGGACRLRVGQGGALLGLIAAGVNLRSRLLGLPYGDQGIFVRREVFERMGGFADLPIMEDADLVMRLRRRGELTVIDATATTSGRRWRACGVVRTTLINWSAMILFKCGVAPTRIRRFYDRALAKRGVRDAPATRGAGDPCEKTNRPTTSS